MRVSATFLFLLLIGPLFTSADAFAADANLEHFSVSHQIPARMRQPGVPVAYASRWNDVAHAKDQNAPEQFQGDWTAEVETDAGKKKATLSVDGKKIRFDGPDGQEWYEGTFAVDPNAKPKRISVLIEDCPFEQFKKQTVEGIYTLEGDVWTICATAPGAPQGPSGFDDKNARTIEFKKDSL